ncbi:hypothetical protein LCGC14_1237850 [marine sediment metagenome]|uniref:Uncharacterized protein n=1 Tax=marine sediment metagenome TaxID=412755 RepID=A0A0F9NNY8_9ZZZZ
MKRFIIAIAILALFVPGLVDALQLTQGWNESTLSANAEIINSTGAFQHKGLWNVNDDFTGSSIDSSIWNTSTNAAGTVTLEPDKDRVFLFSGPTTANAAMLIDKLSLDPLNDEFRLDATVPSPIAGDTFITFNSILEPAVMPNAQFSSDRVITMGSDQVLYIDNVGAFHSWNGSAWQAGTGGALSYHLHRAVLINFDDSGTMRWKLLLFDSARTQQDETTPVAWSATRAPAGGKSLWFWTGTARTDAASISFYMLGYTRYDEPEGINYSTSAQIVNTDTITFAEDFNSDDIQILVGNIPTAATEFKIYVQENAGAFGSAINVNTTILAGETGWHDFMPGSIFNSHTSITLKVELNTPNSDLQLKAYAVKIKGVTIAGGGAADDKLIGGTLGGF